MTEPQREQREPTLDEFLAAVHSVHDATEAFDAVSADAVAALLEVPPAFRLAAERFTAEEE